jgi:hypothetical protein
MKSAGNTHEPCLTITWCDSVFITTNQMFMKARHGLKQIDDVVHNKTTHHFCHHHRRRRHRQQEKNRASQQMLELWVGLILESSKHHQPGCTCNLAASA